MPLTNSLYVPGKLCDLENVIVDIGTGYYVQKVVVFTLLTLAALIPPLEPRGRAEALPGESGLHPDEPGDPAGDDTEEAGQHELLDQCNADEATSAGIRI